MDAFRLRHLVDETAAHLALGCYLRQPRSQRARLSAFARQLRASTALPARCGSWTHESADEESLAEL